MVPPGPGSSRERDRRCRVNGPAPVPPDADTEKRNCIAAALLFTVVPSDRALAGWRPVYEARDDLAVLSILDRVA